MCFMHASEIFRLFKVIVYKVVKGQEVKKTVLESNLACSIRMTLIFPNAVVHQSH